MSSFGKWYEEKKAEEAGETNSSGGSWLSTESLPLWENAELPTFSGMRASLESQLPQNVMGMNYQQRFQVSFLSTNSWLGGVIVGAFGGIGVLVFGPCKRFSTNSNTQLTRFFLLLHCSRIDNRPFVPSFFSRRYSLRWPSLWVSP